jgi:hypothetical protein
MSLLYVKCLVENSTDYLEDYHKVQVQNYKMTTSAYNATDFYIQGSQRQPQSPAEQWLGLSLMINMLSQLKQEGKTLLYQNVYCMAKDLAITKSNRLLNSEKGQIV